MLEMKRERNQNVIETEMILSGVEKKNIKIQNKEIEILKIYDCKLENIEMEHCKIHKIWIENSVLEQCKFIDVKLDREDARIEIQKSQFQNCEINEFYLEAFQGKSKWIEVLFQHTKFDKIYFVTHIEIEKSRFECCKGNQMEFQGDQVRESIFYKVEGWKNQFQGEFIRNQLKEVHMNDCLIKVKRLEVKDLNCIP